jgi:putative flippase GtrA
MQRLSSLFAHRHARILKFLISGGTAAVVDLGVLYLLSDVYTNWYAGLIEKSDAVLIAAIIAFVFAFGVSFTLQKFWTFEDSSVDVIHSQLAMYLVLALCGLGVNTLFMYVLLNYTGLHYLAAQIFASAFIAVGNFFVYKHFIFTGAVPAGSTEKYEKEAF